MIRIVRPGDEEGLKKRRRGPPRVSAKQIALKRLAQELNFQMPNNPRDAQRVLDYLQDLVSWKAGADLRVDSNIYDMSHFRPRQV